MSAGEGIAWMSRSVSFADVAGEAAREAARRAGVLDWVNVLFSGWTVDG